MIIVWRMDGFQFAGATQMLPLGASAEQSEETIQSLIESLGGKVPNKGERLKLTRETFVWKEYRTSTKQHLCAMVNSLRQFLPQGWNLNMARPGNLLSPKTSTGERCKYLPEEVALIEDKKDMNIHFIHDYKSGLRFADYYIDESFFKLIFAADEGTEVSDCFKFILIKF